MNLTAVGNTLFFTAKDGRHNRGVVEGRASTMCEGVKRDRTPPSSMLWTRSGYPLCNGKQRFPPEILRGRCRGRTASSRPRGVTNSSPSRETR